MDPMHHKML
jgi:chromosome segregation ATPase